MSINVQTLNESAVRAILENDERAARENKVQSYWKTYMETLEGLIANPDFRNTVFLHATKSIAALNEATTTAQVATYNKMLVPTIISRMFPKAVAMQFVATRQLDQPTQIVQTFRLARENAKNGLPAGAEFMDPSAYKQYANYKDPKGLLDPNYSHMRAVDAFTSGASVSLSQTPVIPGTIVIWEVSDADPRERTKVALDPGVAGQPFRTPGGTAITGSSVISYGVLNGAKGSINTTGITPGANKHLEVETQINQERNVTDINAVTFKHDLISIATKARKLTATVSAEAIQDLSAYSDGKLDALRELAAGLSDSAALEIDAEIISHLIANAGFNSTWDHAYPAGTFRGTRAERNMEFVHTLNRNFNTMSANFLRGGDNQWALMHPDTWSILQNTSNFHAESGFGLHGGDVKIGASSANKVISNGHITAAKALLGLPSDTVVCGVGGGDIATNPMLFSTYATMLTPAMPDLSGSDIFSTKIGLMNRYAVTPLLDARYGLSTVQVLNMYNPGA